MVFLIKVMKKLCNTGTHSITIGSISSKAWPPGSFAINLRPQASSKEVLRLRKAFTLPLFVLHNIQEPCVHVQGKYILGFGGKPSNNQNIPYIVPEPSPGRLFHMLLMRQFCDSLRPVPNDPKSVLRCSSAKLLCFLAVLRDLDRSGMFKWVKLNVKNSSYRDQPSPRRPRVSRRW